MKKCKIAQLFLVKTRRELWTILLTG